MFAVVVTIILFLVFGHIQPVLFVVMAIFFKFRSSSSSECSSLSVFGHVHRFRPYSFGHIDLVMLTTLQPHINFFYRCLKTFSSQQIVSMKILMTSNGVSNIVWKNLIGTKSDWQEYCKDIHLTLTIAKIYSSHSNKNYNHVNLYLMNILLSIKTMFLLIIVNVFSSKSKRFYPQNFQKLF